MASIYKEFIVDAPASFVWDAIKDFGAVHKRLAKGFVINTTLENNIRSVTFSNGYISKETLISIDEKLYRLVYASIGGRAFHHNAYFQVFNISDDQSKILWVTDLLPDELHASIAQMVELGYMTIKETIEENYRSQKHI